VSLCELADKIAAQNLAINGAWRQSISCRPRVIDTTDIPEVSADAWQHARQPGLYRRRKKPVTLRLDVDIVTWFKEHAHDRG